MSQLTFRHVGTGASHMYSIHFCRLSRISVQFMTSFRSEANQLRDNSSCSCIQALLGTLHSLARNARQDCGRKPHKEGYTILT